MSSVAPNLSIDTRRYFLQALRKVLRPVIKLMIRFGIRYDEFADVVRDAYVMSVLSHKVGAGSDLTRDQISWITGISRSQLEHYIERANVSASPAPSRPDTAAGVLHKWHTDSRFINPTGAPLELEFDGTSAPTFRGLVGQLDPEVSPEAVLDELISTKCVAWSEEGRLRALSRFVIRPGDSVAVIEHFGETLSHLIETQEHNSEPANADNKRFDRTVFPDRRLPAVLLPSFHNFARERTIQLLSDLDDWLAHNAEADADQMMPRVDAGLNVFLYVDGPMDSTPISSLTQPRRQATELTAGTDTR
jgi:hypothetical protein